MHRESTTGRGDPSGDVLQYRRQPLDPLLSPRTVAVIGASEKPRSVGRTVMQNLVNNPFGGTVYPINPAQAHILGVKAYPNVAAVPEPLDLAVIVTPAPTVPALIKECVEAGVQSAIIISAGFRETGEQGAALERQILEYAGGKLRIIGPNCLGIMRPHTGLNATFASTIARKGGVGFISQSGALGTAVLDWSIRENFGFSAFFSIGSMLDVGWGELIDYLGADVHTESIVIYMETIGDARAFLSAAREVALTKPIIVLKAGRSQEGRRAAAAHVGAAAGRDDVFDAALRRAGVLRVETIADLFHIAEVLAKQPRPRGPRLAIVTNAGGPGILATDALIAHGGALAELAPETLAQLDALLPPAWSHGNPVDILGDAEPTLFAKTLDIVAHDPNADGLLVILTPQAMTDPTATAEAIKPFAQPRGKPLLASWMGGAEVEIGSNILRASSVPVFRYPDQAVRMFDYMWRYGENLRALYETPAPADVPITDAERAAARALIEKARAARRTLLTEAESQNILAAYGIPMIESRVAYTAAQAVKYADELGYPVVLKINSDVIIRKRQADGVILNLGSAQAVRATFRAIKNTVSSLLGKEKFQGVTVQRMLNIREGYVLYLGSTLDDEFGPVLHFGADKQSAPREDSPRSSDLRSSEAAVEQLLGARFRDEALGLPPLNTTLARRMMEQTRIYPRLREANVDLAALEQILTRFSQLVAEQRWIKAIEIHPLMIMPPLRSARGAGTRKNGAEIVALDARILLHDPGTRLEDLPRLAIRPYPAQYVAPFTLRDGETVLIRPIRPDDEPLMVEFHEHLSEQTVYQRYFHMLNLSQRVAHERLMRICFNDYAREIALVVERTLPPSGRNREGQTARREILAVGRLTRLRGTNDAEFAILIRDDYQRQGLGTELLKRLIEIGRAEGVHRILAEILPENYGMLRVCEKLGFELKYDLEAGVTQAALTLIA